jgi:hypothetical protein
MTINQAGWDRIVRVILGVGLLTITVTGPHSIWGLVGIVPLITGLVGFCPLYKLIGVSTCHPKPVAVRR